jgi:Putative prokaryotic signal transducing protein
MTAVNRGDPDVELVPVLRTGDPGLVAVAKSILDAAGIAYFIRGETLRNVIGWGGVNAGLGDAEFQVRGADAPDALRLLEQLEQSQMATEPDRRDE